MLKDILFWFIIVTGILSPFSSYAATAFWPALLCMLFFSKLEVLTDESKI